MFLAGAKVKAGYYLNRDELDLIAVGGKEGSLPGPDGQRFYRIPLLTVVLLAPLLGSLFVFLMPLVAFALLFKHRGRLSLAGAKAKVRGFFSAFKPAREPSLVTHEGEEQANEAGEAKPKADK